MFDSTQSTVTLYHKEKNMSMTKTVNELARDITYLIKERQLCYVKLNDKQTFELTEERFRNLIQKRLLNMIEELYPPVD
jgi:molybdopterin-guanine dinucleotide biosynthesis protein A